MKFIYVVDYCAVDSDYSAVFTRESGNAWNLASNVDRKVWVMTNSEVDEEIVIPGFYTSKAVYGAGAAGSVIAKSMAGISHSQVRISKESDNGDLTLTLPFDHEIAQLFYKEQPAGRLYLSIIERETTSPTDPGNSIWTGVINACEFTGLIQADFRCEHLLKNFTKSALTATHSRSCQNVLYSRGCNIYADQTDAGAYFKYREDGLVLDRGDDWITSTEFANRPAGFFNGGYLVIDGRMGTESNYGFRPRAQYPIPNLSSSSWNWSGGFRRSIVSHTVTNGVGKIVLDTLLPPDAFTRLVAYRGCDKSKTTCQNTFNNYKFFNGYPYIPLKNIFKSGSDS